MMFPFKGRSWLPWNDGLVVQAPVTLGTVLGTLDVILNEVDTNDVNIDVDLNLNITDDSHS